MSLRLQIILSVIAIVVAIAGLGAAIDYRHEYANYVGDVGRLGRGFPMSCSTWRTWRPSASR